jgi:shikimate kinase
MLNALNGNIIFIGFMGSGKSAVGREIAKRFNKLFLDTDIIIESREDKQIIDIFQEDGEKYFRNLEKEFANFILTSVKNSVISVGGGFPTAVSDIQKMGFVIFLDIDFDYMVSELAKYKGEMEKRPLMQNLEMARKIYDSRQEIYRQQADKIFKIKDMSFLEVVDEVEKFLK